VSADEMKQQKAMLLLEHSEATEELAALKERAIRVGRDIRQFGQWLAEDAARKIYTRDQQQYGVAVDLLDDKFSQAVNFLEATKLADEIRVSMDKVRDLELRKRNLGLA